MTDDFEPMHSDETHDSDTPVLQERRSSRRLVVAIVAIVAVGALAFGGVRANAVWGRHAMMVTGATAAQALVEGSAEQLAVVSNADVRSGLTTTTAAAMKAKGVLGEFSAPVWRGDEATITVTTGSGVGQLLLSPADDADIVLFRTDGAVGMASGALAMQRAWSGWVVSGLAVAPIKKPAAHPSVGATSTTTATPAP